jgi:predicted nucleotidyltransferase
MQLLPNESIIAALLRELPDLAAIYLFGSHASGDSGPDSDLDLGILPPRDGAHRLDFASLLVLQEKLATICSCDVDLINLRLAPTVLAKEVICHGERIYCGDRYAADEFEMLTLSFYQKLNEEREAILRDGLGGERFYS